MAYKIDETHEVKNFVRRNLWKGRTKPFNHILTLTSPTCGDIVDGINRGLIDKKTRLTIFEKEPSFVKDIHKKLTSLGLKNFDIINLAIEDGVEIICQLHKIRPFDLVYLDFCGNMTKKIKRFLGNYRLYDLFSNVTTAFTFSLNIRQNDLFDFFKPNHMWSIHTTGFPKITAEVAGGIAINKLVWKKDGNPGVLYRASETAHHVFDALGKTKHGRIPDHFILYKEDKAVNNMLFMRINGENIDESESVKQSEPDFSESYDWRTSNKVSLNGLLTLTLSELHAKRKEETNPARQAWYTRAINLKSKG